MGLMDAMKDAMDTVRKIELSQPMELDALYEVLKADASVVALGEQELKKGLLGKSINFPKVSRVTPKITVKGTKVTIQRIQDTSSTSVSIGGGPSMALDKDLRGMNGVHTMMDGSAYFKSVCDAVENALQGK